MRDTRDVNQFISTAARYASEFRRSPESHGWVIGDVRARFEALPAVLKPYTLDQLKAYALTGSDTEGRVNADQVVQWLTSEGEQR